MVATRLIVGLTLWLAIFSPAEAGRADQTAVVPLFDNLGDRKSVV